MTGDVITAGSAGAVEARRGEATPGCRQARGPGQWRGHFNHSYTLSSLLVHQRLKRSRPERLIYVWPRISPLVSPSIRIDGSLSLSVARG
jgi:hypothetical protein